MWYGMAQGSQSSLQCVWYGMAEGSQGSLQCGTVWHRVVRVHCSVCGTV